MVASPSDLEELPDALPTELGPRCASQAEMPTSEGKRRARPVSRSQAFEVPAWATEAASQTYDALVGCGWEPDVARRATSLDWRASSCLLMAILVEDVKSMRENGPGCLLGNGPDLPGMLQCLVKQSQAEWLSWEQEKKADGMAGKARWLGGPGSSHAM